jgi:ABC-type phosphate transport system auxiliary subunit
MAMRPIFHIAVIGTIGVWPAQALACTLCDSGQAISVRARLLQPDLWLNLGAVGLPLVMLAGVIALVAHDPRGGSRPE